MKQAGGKAWREQNSFLRSESGGFDAECVRSCAGGSGKAQGASGRRGFFADFHGSGLMTGLASTWTGRSASTPHVGIARLSADEAFRQAPEQNLHACFAAGRLTAICYAGT